MPNYNTAIYNFISQTFGFPSTSNAHNSFNFGPILKILNPAELCFKEHSGMYKITLLAYLLWKLHMFRSNPGYPEFQTNVESPVKLA